MTAGASVGYMGVLNTVLNSFVCFEDSPQSISKSHYFKNSIPWLNGSRMDPRKLHEEKEKNIFSSEQNMFVPLFQIPF